MNLLLSLACSGNTIVHVLHTLYVGNFVFIPDTCNCFQKCD